MLQPAALRRVCFPQLRACLPILRLSQCRNATTAAAVRTATAPLVKKARTRKAITTADAVAEADTPGKPASARRSKSTKAASSKKQNQDVVVVEPKKPRATTSRRKKAATGTEEPAAQISASPSIEPTIELATPAIVAAPTAPATESTSSAARPTSSIAAESVPTASTISPAAEVSRAPPPPPPPREEAVGTPEERMRAAQAAAEQFSRSGKLPPRYSGAARRLTAFVVALPIVLVCTPLLWQRIVEGQERKTSLREGQALVAGDGLEERKAAELA